MYVQCIISYCLLENIQVVPQCHHWSVALVLRHKRRERCEREKERERERERGSEGVRKEREREVSIHWLSHMNTVYIFTGKYICIAH